MTSTSNSNDFIDTFQAWVGDTEVPKVYFKWASIALVASSLANRVWVSKRVGARDVRVWPNLYILLLGPSGNGKSMACDASLSIMRQADYAERLNLYPGKITAPAMYDEMRPGVPGSKGFKPWRSLIWLVNDELANDVGNKEHADLLIKSLTEMYTCHPFIDSTRTNGTVKLDYPYIVNWFACTTAEWLVKTLDRDAILGGFFARVITIRADYTGKRIFEGVQPKNHAEQEAWLVQQVGGYLKIEGEFKRTIEAREREERWYNERDLPKASDKEGAGWRREHDLLIKLSLVHAVARGSTGTIDLVDMEWGIDLLYEATQVIPELAALISLTPEALVMQDILGCIEAAGATPVKHTRLLKYAYERGVYAPKVNSAIETWEGAGLISVIDLPRSKGGKSYRWLGKGGVKYNPKEVD
jgi:hypothetical protein